MKKTRTYLFGMFVNVFEKRTRGPMGLCKTIFVVLFVFVARAARNALNAIFFYFNLNFSNIVRSRRSQFMFTTSTYVPTTQ